MATRTLVIQNILEPRVALYFTGDLGAIKRVSRRQRHHRCTPVEFDGYVRGRSIGQVIVAAGANAGAGEMSGPEIGIVGSHRQGLFDDARIGVAIVFRVVFAAAAGRQ